MSFEAKYPWKTKDVHFEGWRPWIRTQPKTNTAICDIDGVRQTTRGKRFPTRPDSQVHWWFLKLNIEKTLNVSCNYCIVFLLLLFLALLLHSFLIWDQSTTSILLYYIIVLFWCQHWVKTSQCSNNVRLSHCTVYVMIAACLSCWSSGKAGQVDTLGYKQGHKGSTLLPKAQNRVLIPSTDVFTLVEKSVGTGAPFEDLPARAHEASVRRNTCTVRQSSIHNI